MNHRKNLNAGFIGILALLITVCIMIFLIMKTLTSIQGEKVTGETYTNTDQNIAEPSSSGFAPIDSAKNAKNLIEQDNARAIQQLK